MWWRKTAQILSEPNWTQHGVTCHSIPFQLPGLYRGASPLVYQNRSLFYLHLIGAPRKSKDQQHPQTYRTGPTETCPRIIIYSILSRVV